MAGRQKQFITPQRSPFEPLPPRRKLFKRRSALPVTSANQSLHDQQTFTKKPASTFIRPRQAVKKSAPF